MLIVIFQDIFDIKILDTKLRLNTFIVSMAGFYPRKKHDQISTIRIVTINGNMRRTGL